MGSARIVTLYWFNNSSQNYSLPFCTVKWISIFVAPNALYNIRSNEWGLGKEVFSNKPGDKPIWMEGCWEEENHFIPSLGVPKGGKALKTKEAWMGKQIYLNFCSLGLNVNTLIISFIPYTTSCGRISNDNCGVDRIGGSDDLNQWFSRRKCQKSSKGQQRPKEGQTGNYLFNGLVRL